MKQTPPVHHRWFRFSLRTLFVVMTLLAIPLGWVSYAYHWIKLRQAFLRSEVAFFAYSQSGGPPPPCTLRLFGELGVSEICFYSQRIPEKDLEKARDLFPEAKEIQSDFWNKLAPGLGDETPLILRMKSTASPQPNEHTEQNDAWNTEEPVDLLKPPDGERAFPK